MSETDKQRQQTEGLRGPQVFISYCSEDKSVADEVCAGLESSGITCWIAPRDVRPGENWAGSIIKSISAAKVMVLIFSRHTNASRHVMNEIERAVSHRVTVVPFRIDEVKPSEDLELFISSCHWLDAFKAPRSAKIGDLVRAVSGAIGREAPATAAVSAPAPQKPARGLVTVAAAAVAVAVAAAAFFAFRSRDEKAARAEVAAATPAPVAPAASPAPTAPPEASPAPSAVAVASPSPSAPPRESAEELNARAKSFEEEQNFVAALEIYGKMLASDPDQTAVRARASNAIARIMGDGREDGPDLVPAVRAVAVAGVPAAQNFLGVLLRESAPAESLAMFKKAAEQGVPRAMAEVGLMIANGDGAPADMVEAVRWLKRSADAGFPEGMLLYAECLIAGKGTEINAAEAAALYSKAAALGNVAAKSYLAGMYQHGLGVPAPDPKKAFQLYKEAAAQGFPEALGRLGAMYMSGEAGAKDEKKAVQLWEDGASKGDAVSMYFLAISLESGEVGPPDKAKAASWYRKAAQAGNADAQEWCAKNRVDF